MTNTETAYAAWLATLPRKVMGAGVLFTDVSGDETKVLLVEPTYRDTWGLPGGVVEAGESPRDGAARETLEELGFQIQPGRLLVVDWIAPRPIGGDSVDWMFEGGQLPEGTNIVLQEEELRSWAWCTTEEVAERTHERLARRIANALTAQELGVTFYLENGLQVSGA
ncbi:NUDIX domain-containing protein [Kineosporia babensis]|uniref:NUDIX hydrolase n=1 Tax=Kineosporia babensis TaxID=499548 RepID=A0A9X1NLE3_9ACTN|nr:NUDIX hydrolase [Kineosporia babensis]